MSIEEDEELFEISESKYGFCPDCGTPLENWGAASHGDGDIFDEIGCPLCEEVKDEIHASYCHCPDCDPYFYYEDDDGEPDFIFEDDDVKHDQ